MGITLKGTTVVGGIGEGKAKIINCSCPDYEIREIKDSDRELGRFVRTLKQFCEITRAQMKHVEKTIGKNEAAILDSHIKMTHDLALQTELINIVGNGMCAEEATSIICDMYISRFMNADSDFVRKTALDVMDLKTSVLNMLLGIEAPDVEHFTEDTIIISEEVTPSVAARLDRAHVKGIIVKYGYPKSHSANLVQAMNIPTIIGVRDIIKNVKDGDFVTLNGDNGTVIIEN